MTTTNTKRITTKTILRTAATQLVELGKQAEASPARRRLAFAAGELLVALDRQAEGHAAESVEGQAEGVEARPSASRASSSSSSSSDGSSGGGSSGGGSSGGGSSGSSRSLSRRVWAELTIAMRRRAERQSGYRIVGIVIKTRDGVFVRDPDAWVRGTGDNTHEVVNDIVATAAAALELDERVHDWMRARAQDTNTKKRWPKGLLALLGVMLGGLAFAHITPTPKASARLSDIKSKIRERRSGIAARMQGDGR